MSAENLTTKQIQGRIYYLRNKEKIKQRVRDYYRANTEHVAAVAKTYREANKERKYASDRAYREGNKATLRIKKAAYYQRTKSQQVERNRIARTSNPERSNEYSRKWRREHPEERRVSSKNNKIKRRRAVGFCSPVQWVAKCQYWGWRCYLCGLPVTSASLHMEHRKPLSRGGSHWPANLAPACEKCNLSKSNKTEAEYRAAYEVAPAVCLHFLPT